MTGFSDPTKLVDPNTGRPLTYGQLGALKQRLNPPQEFLLTPEEAATRDAIVRGEKPITTIYDRGNERLGMYFQANQQQFPAAQKARQRVVQNQIREKALADEQAAARQGNLATGKTPAFRYYTDVSGKRQVEQVDEQAFKNAGYTGVDDPRAAPAIRANTPVYGDPNFLPGETPNEMIARTSGKGKKSQAVAPSQAGGGKGFDEQAFKKWYAEKAKALKLNPNPDDPSHFYDYRAAFAAGKGPDSTGHWPSEFKKEGHPRQNLFYDGAMRDTRTGQPVQPPQPQIITPQAEPYLSPSGTNIPGGNPAASPFVAYPDRQVDLDGVQVPNPLVLDKDTFDDAMSNQSRDAFRREVMQFGSPAARRELTRIIDSRQKLNGRWGTRAHRVVAESRLNDEESDIFYNHVRSGHGSIARTMKNDLYRDRQEQKVEAKQEKADAAVTKRQQQLQDRRHSEVIRRTEAILKAQGTAISADPSKQSEADDDAYAKARAQAEREIPPVQDQQPQPQQPQATPQSAAQQITSSVAQRLPDQAIADGQNNVPSTVNPWRVEFINKSGRMDPFVFPKYSKNHQGFPASRVEVSPGLIEFLPFVSDEADVRSLRTGSRFIAPDGSIRIR